LIPVIVVLVTGVLAAATVALDGPQLHLVGQRVPRPDKHRVQVSLDRVLLARPITFAPDSVDLTNPRELQEVGGILDAAPSAGMPRGSRRRGSRAEAVPGPAKKVADALAAAGVPAGRLVPQGSQLFTVVCKVM
jgi:hypothetical protein